MKKSKTPRKTEETPADIFNRKTKLLKEQIKPYTEYNFDNLLAISKRVLEIFTKEEISGKEENLYKLLHFAYLLEQNVIRPHFKIRRNKTLPLVDTFSGIFPRAYCVVHHRDEWIAEQKKHKEALAAYRKEYPERNVN